MSSKAVFEGKHTVTEEADGTWTFCAKGLTGPRSGSVYDAAPDMLVVLRLALGAISMKCSLTREAVEQVIARAEGRG